MDASLVMAVAYWESAWDQSKVSSTGAVGLMQIQPEVGSTDGPRPLGRPVDLEDPYDNTEKALAAYYQGGPSVASNGAYPDTQRYERLFYDRRWDG